MKHASQSPHRPGRPWPAAVVFDMDGLLLDSEVLALQAMHAAGQSQGVDMPASLLRQMVGIPADAVRRLVAATYGSTLDLDRLFDHATQHLEALVQAGLLRVKPGVHDLLDALDALGLPRAVATSSSRHRARHHLQVAGLLDRLGPLLTRDDVPRGKPHPDLYLAAARHLNQPPAHCLAFEDSYNGVHAAAAAGMPVIMVPDLLPANADMHATAVQVVASLHEVVRLFGQPAQSAA